ncbi:MAG: DUF4082 domain-containing protein [Bacteroidetes bacterium]|nr:DUF4082 domain-containing protein [Bacteroidota bacterium]
MKTNSFLKSFRLLMLLISLSMIVVYCSSDRDEPVPPPVYPDENPLAEYYNKTGFNTTTNFVNSMNYEFGLVFSPNVKGKIKAITAKLPDANPMLKITIWDFATHNPIRTETINVAVANTDYIQNISELQLEKDKKYLITMYSNDWYDRRKADNSAAAYPLIAGNITFHDYLWINSSGAATVYPTSPAQNYNGGDISFVFQRIE